MEFSSPEPLTQRNLAIIYTYIYVYVYPKIEQNKSTPASCKNGANVNQMPNEILKNKKRT